MLCLGYVLLMQYIVMFLPFSVCIDLWPVGCLFRNCVAIFLACVFDMLVALAFEFAFIILRIKFYTNYQHVFKKILIK